TSGIRHVRRHSRTLPRVRLQARRKPLPDTKSIRLRIRRTRGYDRAWVLLGSVQWLLSGQFSPAPGSGDSAVRAASAPLGVEQPLQLAPGAFRFRELLVVRRRRRRYGRLIPEQGLQSCPRCLRGAVVDVASISADSRLEVFAEVC